MEHSTRGDENKKRKEGLTWIEWFEVEPSTVKTERGMYFIIFVLSSSVQKAYTGPKKVSTTWTYEMRCR